MSRYHQLNLFPQAKIRMTPKLRILLESIKENPVPNLLLKLNDEGTYLDCFQDNYPDFLDYNDKDDTITYFSKSMAEKKGANVNAWTHNSRQSTKPSRLINKIINRGMMTSINDSAIESFVNVWKTRIKSGAFIEVMRGWDILEAYNYNQLVDRNIRSCALFHQDANRGGHAEPKVKWYYPLIYNVAACALVIVREKGVIVGRTNLFEGIQHEDSGMFKKGVKYTFIGQTYSTGGHHTQLISDWAEKSGFHSYSKMRRTDGSIIIPFDCTFNNFPPLDYLVINPKKNLLSTFGDSAAGWTQAYGYTKKDRFNSNRDPKEEEFGETLVPAGFKINESKMKSLVDAK